MFHVKHFPFLHLSNRLILCFLCICSQVTLIGFIHSSSCIYHVKTYRFNARSLCFVRLICPVFHSKITIYSVFNPFLTQNVHFSPFLLVLNVNKNLILSRSSPEISIVFLTKTNRRASIFKKQITTSA